MAAQTLTPDTEQELLEFREWFIEQLKEMKREQCVLAEQKRRLQQEAERLERMRRDFDRAKESQERLRAQQESLFHMKQKVLEEELRRLADERKAFDAEREEFYARVKQAESEQMQPVADRVLDDASKLFFAGVESEMALKKRYKDLIKIYHPDNLCGDNDVLQAINLEYDRLCAFFVVS